MSKINSRVKQLEKRRGGDMPEVITLYFDNDVVSKEWEGGSHPELVGKTSEEVSALYAERDDVLIIKIVYASQDGGA